jgi:hypothetical protein
MGVHEVSESPNIILMIFYLIIAVISVAVYFLTGSLGIAAATAVVLIVLSIYILFEGGGFSSFFGLSKRTSYSSSAAIPISKYSGSAAAPTTR